MKTKNYKFRIEYEGLADEIYREIEVASDMRLDRFGYLVFSSFDTLGVFDFSFSYRNVNYRSLPEWARVRIDGADPRETRLCEMHLVRGSVIYVFYDLVRDQTFVARFLGASEASHGVDYPRITHGKGLGIIEEVSSVELARRVRRIHRLGESDELYRSIEFDSYVPWDVRAYDIDVDNARLRSRMELFEERYSKE